MDEIESLNVRSEPMGQEWAKSRNSEENAQTTQSESFKLVPLIWNSPGMVRKYQTTLESRVRPLSIGCMFPFAQDNQLIPIVLESHCCFFFSPLKSVCLDSKLYGLALSLPQCSKPTDGISLAVQGLRLCLPMQGVQVPSLVEVLRSHMPCGQKTETYNRRNIVTFKKDLKIVWRFYN